jgi:hypothetical protein
MEHEIQCIKSILRAQSHDSRHLSHIETCLIEKLRFEKAVAMDSGLRTLMQTLEYCNKQRWLSLQNSLLVGEGAEGFCTRLASLSWWSVEDMCEDIIACVRAFRTVPGVAVVMEVGDTVVVANISRRGLTQIVHYRSG